MHSDYIIEKYFGLNKTYFLDYGKCAEKFPFVLHLRGECDTCVPNFGIFSGIFTHPKVIGKPQN